MKFKLEPDYEDNPEDSKYYFTKEQSQACLVTLAEDGKLKDYSGKTCHGKYIFVLEDQNLYLVPLSREEAHHSDSVQGRPVNLVGELRIVAGKIIKVNNDSGHYKPPPHLVREGLKTLLMQFCSKPQKDDIPIVFEAHSKNTDIVTNYRAQDVVDNENFEEITAITDKTLKDFEHRQLACGNDLQSHTITKDEYGYTEDTVHYATAAVTSPAPKIPRHIIHQTTMQMPEMPKASYLSRSDTSEKPNAQEKTILSPFKLFRLQVKKEKRRFNAGPAKRIIKTEASLSLKRKIDFNLEESTDPTEPVRPSKKSRLGETEQLMKINPFGFFMGNSVQDEFSFRGSFSFPREVTAIMNDRELSTPQASPISNAKDTFSH